MGFFSFKTADTEESIPASASGMSMKPVYLLQPNGKKPIREDHYEGYGVFGGVDCYEWLSKANNLKSRNLAVYADAESYYEDDNNYYACEIELSENDLRTVVPDQDKHIVMFDDYAVVMKNGLNVKDMVKQKLIRPQTYQLAFPLKFSFDENAVYENLTASKECEFNGYDYPYLYDNPGMGF
jgi:hypothetical protein